MHDVEEFIICNALCSWFTQRSLIAAGVVSGTCLSSTVEVALCRLNLLTEGMNELHFGRCYAFNIRLRSYTAKDPLLFAFICCNTRDTNVPIGG